MGKPTICIGENKSADQLRGKTAKLITAFVFATRIVQFLFYLNLKFQASRSSLCLYRPVCVAPVRKPYCWISHETAQIKYCIPPFQAILDQDVSTTIQLKATRFYSPGEHYVTITSTTKQPRVNESMEFHVKTSEQVPHILYEV